VDILIMAGDNSVIERLLETGEESEDKRPKKRGNGKD
jgi:hypothetical protein